MSPCKDTATLLSIPEDRLEDTPSSPPVGTWTIRPINILPYPLRDPSLRLRLSLLLVIASFSLISILCISVELVVRHLQQLNTDAPTLLQLELDQQQLTQFGQQIEEQLQQQQRQQLGQQSESSLLFNLKLVDEPGRIVLQFGQDETADVDILEQSRSSFKNLEQSSSSLESLEQSRSSIENLEQTNLVDSVPVNSFSDSSETNDVDEISEDLQKLWRNRRMSR
ncbi:uncharacterized protein LOC111704291 [Eurytemora carolleeae]|uniref:uncharacterized protein LOC111704291 n=1 Tax=Eurytemora carolleeae TaxID=1294199 RepID=UPI000C772890|nr:uncharacterized protein LOC111704291 [Eurytemora carolleeae]|eukprot:XP_023332268.1 uncharacterized protein LOC111704291 [Eurytemora affinis]